MRLSRLRVRLTAGFALAFSLGLGALSATALGYLWREANRRLNERIDLVAQGVVQALQRELQDAPDSSLAFAAHEVVAEWPIGDDSFCIVDEHGTVIAAADRARAIDSVAPAFRAASGANRFTFAHGEQDYRAIAIPNIRFRDAEKQWRFGVISYRSTEGLEGDITLLGSALALTAPLIVLMSLIAGYLLARRALEPMNELGDAITALAPTDLSKRLPVSDSQDEIGTLATAFNALLVRLDDAQQRNHRFVREAAHQIRTPLTLVLGEASHELAAMDDTAPRTKETLGRIRTAAEQMRHRVDELFLLAEAQAGERVRLEDDVELDGLVLECTDLMRARASELGRSLAIGSAEPLIVRGNTMLLREAVIELVENALKYGTPEIPITVSVRPDAEWAVVTVESTGDAFEFRTPDSAHTPGGLGLPIVVWIVHAHGGELRVARSGARNVVSVTLPSSKAAPAHST